MVEAIELTRKKSIINKFSRTIRKFTIFFKIKLSTIIVTIKFKCASK
jgi:hypothetical protein